MMKNSQNYVKSFINNEKSLNKDENVKMFTRRIASFLISWSGKSYKATEKLNNDNSSRLWVPVSPVVFKVDCEEFLSGNGFSKQENNLCFVVCSGLLSH